MRQFFSVLIAAILCHTPWASAQTLSGLARINAPNSHVRDHAWRQVEIHLEISQSVPYRIYQLDDPMQMIVEFSEVIFDGLTAESFDQSKRVAKVQFGALGNGWSRLVLELTEPLGVKSAEMKHDQQAGNSVLKIWAGPVTDEEFAQASGVTFSPMADGVVKDVLSIKEKDTDSQILIVLDPGHGGSDPGAIAGGVREADLMLLLAFELRDALQRTNGIDVLLTREDNSYPSLAERLRFAHRKKADAFISLHADSVTEGIAQGTTIYAVSDQASDKISAKIAQEHDRTELLVGIDLRGAEDSIADVLIDLARQDSIPRSKALAQTTIQELRSALGSVNAKPLRQANFSVLKSPDIPSVLIEVGFMSTQSDLDNLLDEKWRMNFVQGVRNGILKWVGEDSIAAPLRRQ
jgi:N-acetylmuramoyl-L-alanine amidase